MKNIFIKIILILNVFLIGTSFCEASELSSDKIDSILGDQLEIIEFDDIDNILDDNLFENEMNIGSFKNLVIRVIKGETNLSFSDLVKRFIEYLFRELKAHSKLIGEIIIISVLSAILKNLDLSFNNKAVGEVGFYIVYITLILLLFKSYTIVFDLIYSTIEEIHMIMKAVVPTMITLSLASGNITSSTGIYSIITLALDFITTFIQQVLLQVIGFIFILEIINNISKQNILKHFLDFIKKVISKVLKYTIAIFAFVMSLQTLTSPIIDGILNKSAKYAVGVIPVVGSALSGVIDTVLGCSVLIKNGVGIGAVIVLFVMCIIPIIKVLAMILIYKLSASLIQPVSDDRVVNCISSIGDYCSLMLGVMLMVMVLFIASIAILVGSTNLTMMIR